MVWLIVIDRSGIETKGVFFQLNIQHISNLYYSKNIKYFWSILIFAWTIFQWFSTLHTAYFFKWRNLLLKGQELLENVWHDIKSSSLKSKSLTPTIFSNWLIEDPLVSLSSSSSSSSAEKYFSSAFFALMWCDDGRALLPPPPGESSLKRSIAAL